MTQFVPYLLRTGSVLAVAALLSACSSNNNTTRTMPEPEPPAAPVPSADQVARTSLTGLDNSVAALTTLSAADDKAGSARKMAKDYAEMIGTLASDGNSRKARQSAQKVLDAQKSLEDALMAATTAKTAAEEAKGKLPADAEPLLVKALDDAIKKANTQIAAAQKILAAEATETGSLASYVTMVTGDDEDDLKTAADTGKKVAMAVAAALGPKDGTNGNPLRGGADHPSDFESRAAGTATKIPVPGDTSSGAPFRSGGSVKDANLVVMDDATGHTWAEIVGSDKLMDRQIRTGVTGTAGTRSVKVASIAGEKVADVFGVDDLPTDATPNGKETTLGADGTTTMKYKGIPGTVICGGADCAAEDGTLTGSWYFTPTDPMVHYTKATDAATYSEELYAVYGHWLAVVGDNVHFTLLAGLSGQKGSPVDSANSSIRGKWGADANLAASASYSGNAAGRSVHRTFDANGKQTDIQSGRFTADVALTAEFGTSPRLSGTVTNFKSPDNPDAVDPDWSVTLKGVGDAAKAAVGSVGNVGSSFDSRFLTNSGRAKGTGREGGWNASSYGDADKRPEGILGYFNAHFTDGHAAGAYATRKDD